MNKRKKLLICFQNYFYNIIKNKEKLKSTYINELEIKMV